MVPEIEDTGLETFYFKAMYDEKMVDHIRRLPNSQRRWDPEGNRWEIDSDHMDAIVETCTQIYGRAPEFK